ncbi:hypothetical protein AVEN_6819-1 [Araneus ventricosus]|uniref:Uncharacterized protein n=1 Tax=Araneus ventricosus TaxID=182803 RepID=A0A4Y2K397_ARAVE|nr:hypothetical protein AVEN_6819-1 [Araneus ventricosus]
MQIYNSGDKTTDQISSIWLVVILSFRARMHADEQTDFPLTDFVQNLMEICNFGVKIASMHTDESARLPVHGFQGPALKSEIYTLGVKQIFHPSTLL